MSHKREAAAGAETKIVPGVEVGAADADDAPLDRAGIDQLLGSIGAGRAASGGAPESLSLPEVDLAATGERAGLAGDQIELIKDVNVKVRVELGRGTMYLREILKLGTGSVVELEKLAGDPLDIYVNDRLIAKGEVLVLNENFCIRVTEIFSPREVLKLTG